MTRLKTTGLGLLTAGMLATGIGVLAQVQDGEPTTQESPAPSPKSAPKRKAPPTNMTYYVGDLILADPSKPREDGRLPTDMSPLIDLITSTIAPENWKADDESVQNITPFFLSLSLIIRGEPEVHERVGALLKGLRRFSEAHSAALGVAAPHVPKTYKVGDLLRSADEVPDHPGRLDRPALIEMIISTISPRLWLPIDEGARYVVPGPEDDTVIVCQTPEGHERAEAFLTNLRRFRDAQPIKPPAAE